MKNHELLVYLVF